MSFLVSLVAGFSIGIFLRSVFFFGWPVIIFMLLLSVVCLGAWKVYARREYMLVGVFILCVACGMLRVSLSDTPLPQIFARDLHQKVSYTGIVISDPDIRETNQRIVIKVLENNETAKILAVVNKDQKVSVGDSVSLYGTLTLPQPFASEDEGGRIFRYDTYLQKDGIRFLINFASLRVITNAPWYSAPSALARVKHLFLDGISATMPNPYAALAGGVVIGGKQGLGKELQNAFVISGLVQIIVLSGYNVMIVAEWIMRLLSFFKFRRRIAAAAGVAAVILFVAIAGAGTSAIRAALMAMIALYARATGRTYAASRALLVVVLLMLVWNPLLLVFDPGFELSVAATAGLIWLAPLIEIRLAFIKNAFWRNGVATTLAAQIAVLPLLLYMMGRLSLVAIPANLLTLPFVPLAMGFSALAGLAGIVFGSYGFVLALPAYLFNAYIIFIAKTAAALPFASITLPIFPFWLVLVAYAGLIYFAASKRFSTTDQLTLLKKAST